MHFTAVLFSFHNLEDLDLSIKQDNCISLGCDVIFKDRLGVVCQEIKVCILKFLFIYKYFYMFN